MDFEFDPKKSDSNKKKHGIDFMEAQELWKDADLLDEKFQAKQVMKRDFW